MEFMKKLLPKLSFKNPVDVYRMGWLGLAGTSIVYMAVILVRAGLGLDSSPTPQVRYTQSAHSSQMASRTDVRNNAYRGGQYQGTQAGSHQNSGYRNSAQKAHYENAYKAPVYQAAGKQEPKAYRTPQEKIRLIRTQAKAKKATQHSNSRQTQPVTRRGQSQSASRKQPAKRVVANTDRRAPRKNGNADTALNYMNQANYMQKFTYDLNDAGHVKPVIKVIKARKINHDIFGVRLAKGKTVGAIRKEWGKLKKKYRKPLRNLEPLIIKEKNGDGYPVQLIVGPFSDSPSAVRFCASIYRRFNCNLKRYNGSPL